MQPRFFIIWTYVANYGTVQISANSAEEAAEKLYACFSKDFREKATLYIHDKDPTLIMTNGKKV